MRRIGKLGLVLAAVFALGAPMASTALAHGGQEFLKAGTKDGFKGEKGEFLFVLENAMVLCKKEKFSGEDGGNLSMTVTGVVFTYKECEGLKLKEGRIVETCRAKSPGAGPEEIVSETLAGELGWVAKAEVASEVGIDFIPTNKGGVFLTVEGTCLPASPASITGSVAAGVAIFAEARLEGEIVFTTIEGKQAIKTLCLLGALCEGATLMKPKLAVFGVPGSLSSVEKFEYEEPTRVAKGT
jgi:hypothetical protein